MPHAVLEAAPPVARLAAVLVLLQPARQKVLRLSDLFPLHCWAIFPKLSGTFWVHIFIQQYVATTVSKKKVISSFMPMQISLSVPIVNKTRACSERVKCGRLFPHCSETLTRVTQRSLSRSSYSFIGHLGTGRGDRVY